MTQLLPVRSLATTTSLDALMILQAAGGMIEL
jgi:hypothetical protein